MPLNVNWLIEIKTIVVVMNNRLIEDCKENQIVAIIQIWNNGNMNNIIIFRIEEL